MKLTKKTRDIYRRFWMKVRKADGCWEWTGASLPKGYGRFWDGERVVSTHRWSYEQEKGPIPEGLVIDHLCRNPKCVKPDHLRVVTQRENILCGTGLSARRAQQTHCINGHELNEENTYQRKDRPGRGCRVCGKERARRYRRDRIQQ